jgi:hypothetical protein
MVDKDCRGRNAETFKSIVGLAQLAFGNSFPQVKSLELALVDLLDGYTGQFVTGSDTVIYCEAQTIQDSWSNGPQCLQNKGFTSIQIFVKLRQL